MSPSRETSLAGVCVCGVPAWALAWDPIGVRRTGVSPCPAVVSHGCRSGVGAGSRLLGSPLTPGTRVLPVAEEGDVFFQSTFGKTAEYFPAVWAPHPSRRNFFGGGEDGELGPEEGPRPPPASNERKTWLGEIK